MSASRRAALGLLAAAVLLLGAPAQSAPAGHRKGYHPAPEVSWYNVLDHGRRVGFMRAEWTKGDGAPFSFQTTTVMRLPTRMMAERVWWDFGPDLKPASFFTKTIAWQGGQSVTNTQEGDFNYKTGILSVKYHEYGADEKAKIPIPRQQIARYVSELILAHSRLRKGQVYHFMVFSPHDRRFIKQTVTVEGFDPAQHAYKLRETSEEQPGAIGTGWLQPATLAHPNGWNPRVVLAGTDGKVVNELVVTTRDQAIQGFEREAHALGI